MPRKLLFPILGCIFFVFMSTALANAATISIPVTNIGDAVRYDYIPSVGSSSFQWNPTTLGLTDVASVLHDYSTVSGWYSEYYRTLL